MIVWTGQLNIWVGSDMRREDLYGPERYTTYINGQKTSLIAPRGWAWCWDSGGFPIHLRLANALESGLTRIIDAYEGTRWTYVEGQMATPVPTNPDLPEWANNSWVEYNGRAWQRFSPSPGNRQPAKFIRFVQQTGFWEIYSMLQLSWVPLTAETRG